MGVFTQLNQKFEQLINLLIAFTRLKLYTKFYEAYNGDSYEKGFEIDQKMDKYCDTGEQLKKILIQLEPTFDSQDAEAARSNPFTPLYEVEGHTDG